MSCSFRSFAMHKRVVACKCTTRATTSGHATVWMSPSESCSLRRRKGAHLEQRLEVRRQPREGPEKVRREQRQVREHQEVRDEAPVV